MRDDRNPLLWERWIGGLGKAGVPLSVPGIEPVVQIVRREKDMEIRIV
jgi:hypothetical protein